MQGVDLELATRIGDALEQAERASANPRLAFQMAREAVETLRAAPGLSAILGQIEPERLARLLEMAAANPEARRLTWDILDLVRRPEVLRRIPPQQIDCWSERILTAVERSHLTVGPMFRGRAELYGSKTLFELSRGGEIRSLTWRQVASRVDFLARGLLSLDTSAEPAPVAILSDNRIEMALVDLACLSAGLLDVLIPANSTEADVGYMLRHSGAGAVVVSDERQLQKVLAQRETLTDLRRIICIEPPAQPGPDLLTLDELSSRAVHIPGSLVVERSEAVRIDDTATVMYTSGTTGTPKGISFSHRNLVFKRFARALALPEIGDQDTFLCYLPLFHTFGRFFEMLGCVFWGATYCFLENPSVEALLRGMRTHRPTVFISVPKKWIQLYEVITQEADALSASEEELLEATRRHTGGQLRWGLSAAGHLDSDIFRFFQRQGVELMSGFGMTEATGGITMTPPGEYRDDSLGLALPGIELKLADDGELLMRGPYVMQGYLDPEDGKPSFDEEGWLHSGDLMEKDEAGHLRLIDRKKEIYKNIKGETIAPQRIENQFRDFESVGRAFLVGDHREYNTLLIHPNPAYQEVDFSGMAPQDVWDHFRSLVVSVNKFLAPYERLVDFAVIDRDLDPELGELTPKGTPRRKTVVRNFDEVIRAMYRRAELRVGGVELRLPNWLFQTLGLTAKDFRIDQRLHLAPLDTSLTVEQQGERIRIGSCLYRYPPGPVNIGWLLVAPRFWLGNRELVDFVPLEAADRQRPGRAPAGIEWLGHAEPLTVTDAERQALAEARDRGEHDIQDVDLAARLLGAEQETDRLAAIELLATILGKKEATLDSHARIVLGRAADSESLTVARAAFRALAPAEIEPRFPDTLDRFLSRHPELLDEETRRDLAERTLPAVKVEAIISATRRACLQGDDVALAASLLNLLAAYGTAHPTRYRRLRAFLVRMSLFAGEPEVRQRASQAHQTLERGFRDWLGPATQIAVDPETHQEYRWEHVVVFEEGTPAPDRQRLLEAIRRTALLREAFFLFSRGTLIRLNDIPPGGVWVRLLGSRHGKSVYRITVQTRYQGAYDLAVNVSHELTAAQIEEEITWLIVSGDPGARSPLVEDFGGYWPEQQLWSEEFISGETLDRSMRRLSRSADREERFRELWPFLAWSTLSAYVEFWDRSGKRGEIADPSLSNVVVPTEDFHIGARIVSLSARRPHGGLTAMLLALREQFVRPAEALYPMLAGEVDWEVIFFALLEIVGEQQGLAQLEQVRDEDETKIPAEMRSALERFIERTRAHGFVPMRLHFAIRRYRAWDELSPDATLQARARTLLELFDTYGLQRLVEHYPEVRFRYFRDTVFRRASGELAEGLDGLIDRIRRRQLHAEDWIDAVADLRSKLAPEPDDDYFLTRMSFPHLRPEDTAGFVRSQLAGRHQSEIVVRLEDDDGRSFQVRHALSPKEVGRLHRLFVGAKLEVQFRAEHQFLVAINDRDQIIAGIYYEIEEDGHAAHLEKIVVSDAYRRKGVADGLIHDFFNRLRAAGVKAVTTGFFRPEYFYGYGFRIEPRYAGLVKSLEASPEGS